MPYDSVITRVEIDKLLKFLDYFQDKSNVFYYEKNGYFFESDEVLKFYQMLDETGFLMVFDWRSWIADHEIYSDLSNSIANEMKEADLETLRKLLTSYMRGNRFNEGLFIHAIENGHITNILLRLRELAANV